MLLPAIPIVSLSIHQLHYVSEKKFAWERDYSTNSHFTLVNAYKYNYVHVTIINKNVISVGTEIEKDKGKAEKSNKIGSK